MRINYTSLRAQRSNPENNSGIRSWIATSLLPSGRSLLAMTIIVISQPTFAADNTHTATHEEHNSQLFHMIKLETDVGASNNGTLTKWDLDGWVGGDYHKLWLKSEGEVLDGRAERAEYWAMYSRNIATFWDAQVGIRYDDKPKSTTYFVTGFEGLAPYLFETKVHLFVSDKGDVSARLREENDLLITQRLITKPYIEINLSAQDIPEQEIGAGFTSGDFGLQTRYEITRKFAPYIDLRYESKFGETANLVKKAREDTHNSIASVGLKLMF